MTGNGDENDGLVMDNPVENLVELRDVDMMQEFGMTQERGAKSSLKLIRDMIPPVRKKRKQTNLDNWRQLRAKSQGISARAINSVLKGDSEKE